MNDVALADLRDVSAVEFARITGMSYGLAKQTLASGSVPTAYRTDGRQWRVALHGIRLWQERRGLHVVAEQGDHDGE